MDLFDDIVIDNGGEDTVTAIETEETLVNEWLLQRLGMITGSTFAKLIVSDKKGGYTLSKSQTAESLIMKIAYERILKEGNAASGLDRIEINSRETNYGKEYEAEALEKYKLRTANRVKAENTFIQYNEFIGGTPDGFVDEDGLIEIKCPYNGANHLKGLISGEVYNPDYIIQMQFYLWITGRGWCDFVTYDKDLPAEYQLNIIRVDRDDFLIDAIDNVAKQVNEKITEILK